VERGEKHSAVIPIIKLQESSDKPIAQFGQQTDKSLDGEIV